MDSTQARLNKRLLLHTCVLRAHPFALSTLDWTWFYTSSPGNLCIPRNIVSHVPRLHLHRLIPGWIRNVNAIERINTFITYYKMPYRALSIGANILKLEHILIQTQCFSVTCEILKMKIITAKCLKRLCLASSLFCIPRVSRLLFYIPHTIIQLL